MPGQAMDVAASPTSGRAYVSTWTSGGLITMDGRSGEIVAQTPVGPMPLRVAVNPQTERVYAADGTAPAADRGSLWTMEGRKRDDDEPAMGALPLGITTDPEADEVLVTDARLGTLAVLDGSGQAVRWSRQWAPRRMGSSSAGLGRAYIVVSGGNSLAVLDWPPAG